MVSILSHTLSPNTHKTDRSGQASSSGLSPMKCAELRGIYLNQMSELRHLFDNGVLTKEEYEEQRIELVDSMRRLKK